MQFYNNNNKPICNAPDASVTDPEARSSCCVKWNNMLGDAFPILCGIRQGGVLSLYLFAVYVDDLIIQLRQSGHGFSLAAPCMQMIFC